MHHPSSWPSLFVPPSPETALFSGCGNAGKFSTLNSRMLLPCSVGVMIAITPTVSPPFGPSPVVQSMTKPPFQQLADEVIE
jgi:hypothetical protein